jgi:glycosyltransferase involved in cell wall biosynthesis
VKITVVNFSRRKIGGVEQHLSLMLPELERRGHSVQFVYMNDRPADRLPILADSTPDVDVERLGRRAAIDRVRRFEPDIINVHGDVDAAFQAALITLAPSAYSVHNYYGTCISGLKTTQFPVIQACTRRFGPACLVRYFPQRCGGLNPATMLRRYATERNRLAVLSRYNAVITHSRWMQDEYMRHGLAPERIFGLPYEAAASDQISIPRHLPAAGPLNILFAGRMERIKGGSVLIDSVRRLERVLRRRVHLHLAGEGPRREDWENSARKQAGITFHGWCGAAEMEQLFASAHLFAFPSLWPEPFGKTGPEAMARGIPVAAFATGGVSDWLDSGVNGFAAPADPPTSRGLCDAMAQCLENDHVYHRLSQGALAGSSRFAFDAHMDALLELFARLASGSSASPASGA